MPGSCASYVFVNPQRLLKSIAPERQTSHADSENPANYLINRSFSCDLYGGANFLALSA
jgi:hypothetical protein